MGQLNRFIRVAAAEGCRDVVFIGSVARPSLWKIRPDFRRAAADAASWSGCSGAATISCTPASAGCSSEHGFRLVGPKEIAPELTMPRGPLGAASPGEQRPRRHRARACAAQCDQPFRHRPGRGRGRQPGARASKAPEGTDRRWRGWRNCAATAASAARWAAACWSRRQRSARTIASICRRSARKPSSAAARRGSCRRRGGGGLDHRRRTGADRRRSGSRRHLRHRRRSPSEQ